MGVYKRDDTWHISYFRNGKRIRKAIGPVKKTAEAVLSRIKLDIRAGKYSDPEAIERIPIEDLCKEYQKRSAHLKSQSTLKYAVGVIEAHFNGKRSGQGPRSTGKSTSSGRRRMDRPATSR